MCKHYSAVTWASYGQVHCLFNCLFKLIEYLNSSSLTFCESTSEKASHAESVSVSQHHYGGVLTLLDSHFDLCVKSFLCVSACPSNCEQCAYDSTKAAAICTSGKCAAMFAQSSTFTCIGKHVIRRYLLERTNPSIERNQWVTVSSWN